MAKQKQVEFHTPFRVKRGQKISVRRGGRMVDMIVVAQWARGEGDGCAAKLPGQKNHECVDVPASRIAR